MTSERVGDPLPQGALIVEDHRARTIVGNNPTIRRGGEMFGKDAKEKSEFLRHDPGNGTAGGGTKKTVARTVNGLKSRRNPA